MAAGSSNSCKIRFSGLFLREAFWCCLIAFTLNTTAYTTEILRGAISNVPAGEIEAAKACGMSRWLLLRRIVLPRAFRLMLPAYSNEIIFMLQATAIASTVGTATQALDLTGAARVIVAKSFAPYEIYLTIAVMYLALTYLIDFGIRATWSTASAAICGTCRRAPPSRRWCPACGRLRRTAVSTGRCRTDLPPSAANCLRRRAPTWNMVPDWFIGGGGVRRGAPARLRNC